MADVFSPEVRSSVMQRIRSSNNKSTEQRMMAVFRLNDITGWRRNYPVKGHPDFVFLKERLAIFVDGCFWHGHDCRNTRPAVNQEYWQLKREKNTVHDKEVTARFVKRGWRVLRIWECELKKKNVDYKVEEIRKELHRVLRALNNLCKPL